MSFFIYSPFFPLQRNIVCIYDSLITGNSGNGAWKPDNQHRKHNYRLVVSNLLTVKNNGFSLIKTRSLKMKKLFVIYCYNTFGSSSEYKYLS